MTPQSPSFAAYRRRLAKSTMPVLGELVWYTVAEAAKIPHAAFLAECTKHGLETYAPKLPKDVDVFRRACTKAQRKRVPVPNNPELFENYLVRDVKSAAGHFWKQIVIETVDGDNRKLGFDAAVEIHFDPDIPDQLDVQYLTGNPSGVLREVVDAITNHYDEWRGMVYGYSVREFIRAVVTSTGATVVRPSGGVYFVMEAKLDVIGKLDEIVSAFASPTEPDLILHTVPLIDDARQREMLRSAFEAETAGDIDKFVKEVEEALADDKCTDARFAELARRKTEIKTRTEEYSTLLEDALGGTDMRMKKLDSSLKRFYKAIG